MTLSRRDLLAAIAMHGMMSNPNYREDYVTKEAASSTSDLAVKHADALIAELDASSKTAVSPA